MLRGSGLLRPAVEPPIARPPLAACPRPSVAASSIPGRPEPACASAGSRAAIRTAAATRSTPNARVQLQPNVRVLVVPGRFSNRASVTGRRTTCRTPTVDHNPGRDRLRDAAVAAEHDGSESTPGPNTKSASPRRCRTPARRALHRRWVSEERVRGVAAVAQDRDRLADADEQMLGCGSVERGGRDLVEHQLVESLVDREPQVLLDDRIDHGLQQVHVRNARSRLSRPA